MTAMAWGDPGLFLHSWVDGHGVVAAFSFTNIAARDAHQQRATWTYVSNSWAIHPVVTLGHKVPLVSPTDKLSIGAVLCSCSRDTALEQPCASLYGADILDTDTGTPVIHEVPRTQSLMAPHLLGQCGLTPGPATGLWR